MIFKLSIITFFIFFLTSQQESFAAFPIKKDQKANQTFGENQQQIATLNSSQPDRYFNTHSEDMGIFAILAIIFAGTGLFPFAIICGTIGTQNGRKFKGLAKAGLIIGLLVGVAFVCYLFTRLLIA
jgi:hypothetical protein